MLRIRDLIFLVNLLGFSIIVTADTYSVKIGTDQHINVVDNKFLSFTVDPKYLFSSTGKYTSNECMCMAAALTPSYLRIAGPSTAHMTFHNSTIAINDLDPPLEDDRETKRELSRKLSVSNVQWRKFVEWSKSTGFELVFALNNNARTSSGIWDPNTALDILTVADKVGVHDMYWQLGYECKNQSIEEYLNDLETLQVITETFPRGSEMEHEDKDEGEREGRWRLVGGDVTPCLQHESKSDFKDYVTLSADMMDAVFLNANSSSRELQRMSEGDRLKLLRSLSHSPTPLWLTETSHPAGEMDRAADWLSSLGYSARNGFAVHFRELIEDEMFQPTLSFYMALLFKNLVGERVLDVQLDSEQTVLFAHCTSLRHKPVRGALTLYGVNLGDEPARFSVKLSKKEDGGDIMQFILGNDISGNIVVNGRPMYYEGDIKPIVKRIRPYKTLLINLPPKSFGFWVLANTNIQACQDINEDITEDKQFVEAAPLSDKLKRSVDAANKTNHENDEINTMDHLNERIKSLNEDLKNVHKIFKNNSRTKRQVENERTRLGLKGRKKQSEQNQVPKPSLLDRLRQARSNNTRNRSGLVKKGYKFGKITGKRDSKTKTMKVNSEEIKKLRKRRSIITDSKIDQDYVDDGSENEIEFGSKDILKLGKLLHSIRDEIKQLPSDEKDDNIEYEEDDELSKDDEVLVKTKISGDKAVIDFSDLPKHGFIQNTFTKVMTVLEELNKNMKSLINDWSILE